MRAGLASHLGDTPLSGELCHCHFPPTDTHRLSTIHGHSKHFPSASFFFFFSFSPGLASSLLVCMSLPPACVTAAILSSPSLRYTATPWLRLSARQVLCWGQCDKICSAALHDCVEVFIFPDPWPRHSVVHFSVDRKSSLVHLVK